MPTIDIALASYNGEKYIAAQIDSILSNIIDVDGFSLGRIIVSDNMSTDRTADIVKEISRRNPMVELLINEKRGVINNFNHALENTTADYVMLADQDDIWNSDKIRLTLNKLLEMETTETKSGPLLVFSDLAVTDATLNITHPSFFQHQRIEPDSYLFPKNIFLYNVSPGCVMMFNRALLKLALPVPGTAVMHDWWLLLVASTFGKVAHLEQATMLYRQHDANQIGAPKDRFVDKLLFPRQKYTLAKRNLDIAAAQANAFTHQFPQIPQACMDTIDYLVRFESMSKAARIIGLNKQKISYRTFFGRAMLYLLALTLPTRK